MSMRPSADLPLVQLISDGTEKTIPATTGIDHAPAAADVGTRGYRNNDPHPPQPQAHQENRVAPPHLTLADDVLLVVQPSELRRIKNRKTAHA